MRFPLGGGIAGPGDDNRVCALRLPEAGPGTPTAMTPAPGLLRCLDCGRDVPPGHDCRAAMMSKVLAGWIGATIRAAIDAAVVGQGSVRYAASGDEVAAALIDDEEMAAECGCLAPGGRVEMRHGLPCVALGAGILRTLPPPAPAPQEQQQRLAAERAVSQAQRLEAEAQRAERYKRLARRKVVSVSDVMAMSDAEFDAFRISLDL